MAEKTQYNKPKKEKRYSEAVELEAKKAKAEEKTETPAHAPIAKGVVNAPNGLNARKTPGGEIVAVLSNGAEVEIEETKSIKGTDYNRISKPFKAWVMSRFIKID